MSIWDRMVGALRGHAATFEDIMSDRAASAQAFVISVISTTLVAGIDDPSVGNLLLGAFAGAIGLVAWTGVLWVVARGLGMTGRYTPLMRAIGFTALPFVLTPIPVVGAIAAVFSIALQVVAVRTVFKATMARAAATVVAPWLLLVTAVVVAQFNR